MAATDFVSAVYTKLWALLLARPAVTSAIAANNRIRLDASDLTYPYKNTISDADVPQLSLGIGDVTTEMFTTTPTYARAYATTLGNMPFVEKMMQTYTLALLHRDVRSGDANALYMEVLSALRQGGPKLTDPALKVLSWGPVAATVSIVRTGGTGEGSDGTPRLFHAATIPVTFRLDPADVLDAGTP
jgi:hypothetical protein